MRSHNLDLKTSRLQVDIDGVWLEMTIESYRKEAPQMKSTKKIGRKDTTETRWNTKEGYKEHV